MNIMIALNLLEPAVIVLSISVWAYVWGSVIFKSILKRVKDCK